MVECQWDSVLLSPYSPVLTGLELTFMCLTRSNSSLFSTPGFVVSPVGKRERGEERKERKNKQTKNQKKQKQRWEGGKKEIEKEERKEGGKKE